MWMHTVAGVHSLSVRLCVLVRGGGSAQLLQATSSTWIVASSRTDESAIRMEEGPTDGPFAVETRSGVLHLYLYEHPPFHVPFMSSSRSGDSDGLIQRSRFLMTISVA
jgi:hypothetical protein